MRSKIALILLTLVVLTVGVMPEAQARGPYGSIRVAGWSGGAFTDDQTGQFSSCIANANYKSGIDFGVVVAKNGAWALAFSHPNWSLVRDQKFPIVLSFDGRNTFNVNGAVVSASTVFVRMPETSALIKSFRAARTMSAFAQGNLFQFDLKGTSVLLPTLVTCVEVMNKRGLAGAGDFTSPILGAKTGGQSAPPTAASSLQPNIPQEGSAEYQLEAMQIASNFILKASLTHPTLLSRAETPVSVATMGAAWKADNAMGFVRIVPAQANMSGLDAAAAIIGNDAKQCRGKFASARNSELVDSDVVFRGMSSCEDSEKSLISEYFVFPRKAGGFVMFSVLTPAKTIGQQIQGPQRDEMNAGMRKAAYVSIGN